jgi:hypothetical protein
VAGHQRPGHQLPAFHKRLVFVGEQAERGAAQNLVEGGLPVPCPRDGLYRLRRLREVPIVALGAEESQGEKGNTGSCRVEVVSGAVPEGEALQALPRLALEGVERRP